MSNETKKDKNVKRLLLLAILIACAGVYMWQRRGLSIDGWGGDLNAALVTAKEKDQRVVVFFVANPPSRVAQRIASAVIAKPDNVAALSKSGFVPVVVEVDRNARDKLATKYKLKSKGLPTLMILDAEGKEITRREGTAGTNEVAFRADFLEEGLKK
jgi:hypothetical protein